MIESFVDLTYRGLSLGRRIKLSQVRPSSGTLELALPMPVGTHVAITTDDGVTFDATVSWVFEQIAGSDRPPGMVVVPVLAADPASAWWQARVALPDEDRPKPRAPRGRPVTVRPRATTEPGPPPEGAITEEIPTSIAELQARVHAAARVEPPGPAGAPPDPGNRPTTVMNALDQQELAQLTRGPDGEAAMRRTGEHAVIDDGRETMSMMLLDPSSFDREPATGAGDDAALGAADDAAAGISDDAVADAGDDAAAGTSDDAAAGTSDDAAAGTSDDGDGGEASEISEASGASGAGEAGEASRGDKPSVVRSFFKKRRKRR